MTLRELFVPNKFGTVPMIHFVGVGLGILKDGYVEVTISNRSTKFLNLGTEVSLYNSSYLYINDKELKEYSTKLVHWVPLTPEQILINSAIEPLKSVCVVTERLTTTRQATDNLLAELLIDGTGWIDIGYGTEPATFYVEDILYRLDLQGKLT